MIELLTLLLAALASESETGRRRGKLHEIQGRLGLRAPKVAPDLRQRFLWGYANYSNEVMGWVGNTIHRVTGIPFSIKSWHPSVWKVQEVLPKAGLQSRYDKAVPWLAKEVSLATKRSPSILYLLPVALPSIMDWVEATNPDLMSMRFVEARRASDIWHEQFRGGLLYRKPVIQGTILARWPDGATIQRLDTREQLRQEGESMGHCLGGMLDDDGRAPGGGAYWQHVRDDKSIILSYRDPNGIPHATVELAIWFPSQTSELYIEQIQGPEDLQITADEGESRLTWFLANGLDNLDPSSLYAADLEVPRFTLPTDFGPYETRLMDRLEELLLDLKTSRKEYTAAVDAFEEGVDEYTATDQEPEAWREFRELTGKSPQLAIYDYSEEVLSGIRKRIFSTLSEIMEDLVEQIPTGSAEETKPIDWEFDINRWADDGVGWTIQTPWGIVGELNVTGRESKGRLRWVRRIHPLHLTSTFETAEDAIQSLFPSDEENRAWWRRQAGVPPEQLVSPDIAGLPRTDFLKHVGQSS